MTTDELFPNELPKRGPNNELLYRIPSTTKREKCKRPGCNADVWWVKTKAGKNMIVDVSIAGVTMEPDAELHADGIGTPHWGQCKDREFVRDHSRARSAGD